MAAVYKFTPSYFKQVVRKVIHFEPWRIDGTEGVHHLREQLTMLPKDRALTLDLNGAEISPESVAVLFFFALEHQDSHGVLEVKNVGPICYALLHRMRAHEMPMISFAVGSGPSDYSLN